MVRTTSSGARDATANEGTDRERDDIRPRPNRPADPNDGDDRDGGRVTGPAVTVVVDGALVVGSTAARVERGTVVAPLDPYVRAFAGRIVRGADGRIVIERSGASVTIALGSRVVRTATTVERAAVAPELRADRTIVPLATIARDLGATVTYDGATHTVTLAFARGDLRTPTPFVAGPAATELATFAPMATPQPTPTVGTSPRPRRTPIEVVPPRGTWRRGWEEGRHG